MNRLDVHPVTRRTWRLAWTVVLLGVVVPLPLTALTRGLAALSWSFGDFLPAIVATGLAAALLLWKWHRGPSESPLALNLVVGSFWALGLLTLLEGELEVAWLVFVPLCALPTLGLGLGTVWVVLALAVAAELPRFLGLGSVDAVGTSPSGFATLLAVSVMTAIYVASGRRTDRDIQEVIEIRKRSEQEARAANRAKSDFLANVSHEIRTPMNGVVGMADLLMRSQLGPSDRQKVEVINGSAETLLALVDEILDLSKIEAGKLSLYPVDFTFRDLVTKVALLLRPQAKAKGLKLEVEIDRRLPDRLYGDPVRLRQVLLNLVGNAVKFTHQGEVTLEVGCRGASGGAEDAPVVVGEPVTVEVQVHDTGIGIGERAKTRLFTPFGQADSSSTRHFSGTGLGLVISKRLVELMGGTIGFESRRDVGSTFWFKVPLEPARQLGSDPSGTTVPQREAPEIPQRILVVEDNPVNRLIAQKHLEVLGYQVEAVDGGAEALERLAEEDFDAVLMDCQMPGIDGYETTRRIRKLEEGTQRRTPVIAVTAHAMEGERERCAAAGMDDYLAKPFRGEELAGLLERWLGPASGEFAVDREVLQTAIDHGPSATATGDTATATLEQTETPQPEAEG